MIFDINAWVGTWPFRHLTDSDAHGVAGRMVRAGIDRAVVSSIEAIFHRNPQPLNERLAESLEPFDGKLLGAATINPIFPAWEDDIRDAHEKLGFRAVRLFPQYHDYDVAGSLAKKVVAMCAERHLAVFIPQRVEDVRQHHWMDPGKEVSLGGIADLVAAVPDATVIVPNARGIVDSPLWTRAELRERRWYVDTSLTEFLYGLHYSVDRANPMRGFFDDGGADHLLFGTHQPFSYAASALVKLATLPIDDETRERVAWHSAAEIFGAK